MFATQVVFGGRFDFPREHPQFSIQIPDNWETGTEGDTVTSRPAKDSKVMISIFPVPAAKNVEDAFAIVLKQVSANYRDVKLGKLSEQRQTGMTFFGGQGEGEKDGFELKLSVAGFSPNGQRFFGLVWACDEASERIHAKQLDQILGSIQRFSEAPKESK
jgi:hypothetical protein